MTTQEIWKPVPGFPDYEVSDLGRLKHLTNGKILKPSILKPDGYLKHNLIGPDGKTYQRKLHRIVAEAFLPNPFNFPTVDHKNRIRSDCRLKNLRWASYQMQQENRKCSQTRIETELDIQAFLWPV